MFFNSTLFSVLILSFPPPPPRPIKKARKMKTITNLYSQSKMAGQMEVIQPTPPHKLLQTGLENGPD